MRYADQTQLIADYLPEATSDEEIAAVGRILDAVSSWVDSYCKRAGGFFAPSAAQPTMKRVRGEGQRFLRLPTHVFGTATIEGLDSSVYYESEVNGWIYRDGGTAESERVINGYNPNGTHRFVNEGIYRVTARWGYAAVPLPIAEAVRLITARIYSVQKGTIGQVTAEGFINERLIPQAAKDLLKPFVKREFEI